MASKLLCALALAAASSAAVAVDLGTASLNSGNSFSQILSSASLTVAGGSPTTNTFDFHATSTVPMQGLTFLFSLNYGERTRLSDFAFAQVNGSNGALVPAGGNASSFGSESINSPAGNGTLSFSQIVSPTSGGPLDYRFTFDAHRGGGPSESSPYSMTVNVTAAVPEPHEWAMMLAGLGLVGYVARRRRPEGLGG